MKHCPYCNKIIWPWREKVYTNKSDGNKVYHEECYWDKAAKERLRQRRKIK